MQLKRYPKIRFSRTERCHHPFQQLSCWGHVQNGQCRHSLRKAKKVRQMSARRRKMDPSQFEGQLVCFCQTTNFEWDKKLPSKKVNFFLPETQKSLILWNGMESCWYKRMKIELSCATMDLSSKVCARKWKSST